MPKTVSQEELDRLEALIAQHPEGVGVEALSEILGSGISRRTLQRRLAFLVEQQRISTKGGGRALRYQPIPRVIHRTLTDNIAVEDKVSREIYVPLSHEGEEIRAYIRQPIQQRKPVGYDRELLESYRPNGTHYLSPEIREHLHRIGRFSDIERIAGTYAREILGRLLIDLSWASSRLEGNTYSLLDTLNLIELGREAEGKDRRETQMILNHKAAIELLVEQTNDIGFDTFTFFNLHALLSENLLTHPNESGRLRRGIVEVSGSVFHPLGIPQQIDSYFRLILQKAMLIEDVYEQAFFIMVHIPYLQPFVDVNKRVSRLGANISFIRSNFCPLSFVDVPEQAYVEGTLGVYELKRIELLRDVFVWAYERSCQRYMAIRGTMAEPDPIRLRHREVLIEIVSEIVRGLRFPDKQSVYGEAKSLVPPEDLDRVVDMALDDLRNLHEGNISRYKLRLSEYRAWQQRQQMPD
ncbi:MAG: Fic family protein [Candidatus Thiodiazotropha sp.]